MSIIAPTSVSSLWRPALDVPPLRPGTVHLWRANLCPPEVEACASLSVDEWARSAGFHFQRDRDRFLSARSFTRAVLGSYLGIAPGAVRFEKGAQGKPRLSGSSSTLRFNLSHSEDLLLMAVAHSREVGVDVESMRPDVPFEDLAEHYFPPALAWEIRILPAPQKAARFYEVWTATEARLKAEGTGLGGLIPRQAGPSADRWSLRNLTPAEGFAAAVAVEGSEFQLEYWSCPN